MMDEKRLGRATTRAQEAKRIAVHAACITIAYLIAISGAITSNHLTGHQFTLVATATAAGVWSLIDTGEAPPVPVIACAALTGFVSLGLTLVGAGPAWFALTMAAPCAARCLTNLAPAMHRHDYSSALRNVAGAALPVVLTLALT